MISQVMLNSTALVYLAPPLVMMSTWTFTTKLIPLLHGDIFNGGSISCVEECVYILPFFKCVCILELQDYDTPPAFVTQLDQATLA